MANETWTIKRCLDWTIDYFQRMGVDRARLNAEWLLTSVCGIRRVDVYLNFDKPMSAEELARMHDAVVRRAKGEPLQYIAGKTAFRTIEVACEPGVLIPRPETEVLVEEVLTYLDNTLLGESPAPARAELPWNDAVEQKRLEEERAAAQKPQEETEAQKSRVVGEGTERVGGEVSDSAQGEPTAEAPQSDIDFDKDAAPDVSEERGGDGDHVEPRGARVLEVGCGTGCISLSLATERPGRISCVAIDIEPRAVALTCRNRDRLGIDAAAVDVRRGNLVSPLDRKTEWGTFDVLVSNPPYIPTEVMGTLPSEVADYEPRLALDGGADGLDIFRRLVKAAPHMLRGQGMLACELHETCLDVAAQLCQEAGFVDIRIVRDLADRPRIIVACVPAALTLAAAQQDGRAVS